MNYQIGQTFEYIKPRGIVHGPEITPTWHALTVPPQRERATREYLKAQGVFAFFPSENRQRQHKGARIEVEHPMVSQVVYAKFKQAPQWDVMKEKQRLITGVFSYGETPIEIGSAIIKRLQGLTVRAQALREARQALLEVRAGDRAKITEGPLQGFLVDVTEVKLGQVWFNMIAPGFTPIKASASLATVERIPNDDDLAKLGDLVYEDDSAEVSALTGPGPSAQSLAL